MATANIKITIPAFTEAFLPPDPDRTYVVSSGTGHPAS